MLSTISFVLSVINFVLLLFTLRIQFKRVVVPFKINDTVYYQGMKLVVADINGENVVAVTPGNSKEEATMYSDNYKMFLTA